MYEIIFIKWIIGYWEERKKSIPVVIFFSAIITVISIVMSLDESITGIFDFLLVLFYFSAGLLFGNIIFLVSIPVVLKLTRN